MEARCGAGQIKAPFGLRQLVPWIPALLLLRRTGHIHGRLRVVPCFASQDRTWPANLLDFFFDFFPDHGPSPSSMLHFFLLAISFLLDSKSFS